MAYLLRSSDADWPGLSTSIENNCTLAGSEIPLRQFLCGRTKAHVTGPFCEQFLALARL
jgi:hypothetical protein